VDTHRGRCHCGNVEFEIESDIGEPFECNCSFCVRRGAVLQKVPAKRFAVLQGETDLTRYGARNFSDHFFCSTCGIHVFTRITRENEDSVAVNLACVEGLERSSLAPRLFDGAKLL
jgi:hypothetical protein